MKRFRPFIKQTLDYKNQIRKIIRHMNDIRMQDYVSKENMTLYEHGLKVTYSAVDQSKKEMEMQRTETSTVIPFDQIKNSDFSLVHETLNSLSEQLHKSMMTHFFKVLEQGADEVGNTIDGQGQPISGELIIQMYEKVEMGLDREGNLAIPQLHLHPSMIPKVKEIFDNDKNLQSRVEKILEEKFEKAKADEEARVSKFPQNGEVK